MAQKGTKYLGYFRKKICPQELSEIAQYDHTHGKNRTNVPLAEGSFRFLPLKERANVGQRDVTDLTFSTSTN